MKLSHSLAIAAFVLAGAQGAWAENDVTVHGSIQADALFPQEDIKIGTEKYSSDLLFNSYGSVGLFSKYFDAGLRVEYMEHPLPGFEPSFKGWGIPDFYVKGKYKALELTAGDVYEQFGAGFILRTYEERSLGIDNAIRGGRIRVTVPGLQFTALGGVQRRFWDWSKKSKLGGANAEFSLQDWIKPLSARNITWTIGASYVLKHEDKEDKFLPGTDKKLNIPRNVSAMDFRTHYYKSGLDLQGEFAWKSADPSYDNGYIYNKGTAYMVTAAYSRPGWSLQGQVKRSENMAFRSQRSMNLTSAFINNMPAFAYSHTYALATMYPYATKFAPGEWAYQAAGAYNFKRKTPLGGKYGTKIKANYSFITGINREIGSTKNPITGETADKYQDPALMGTDGDKTKFFGSGPVYYSDLNIQLEKRILAPWNLNFMYMNQRYNKSVIEGHGGMVKSNIYILENKIKLNHKFILRTEFQYLHTKQDRGDWCFGLAELSWQPYLMFTVSDQWNHGNGPQDELDRKEGLGTNNHYYFFGVTGTYKSSRLMVSYGRTRAGYNCSGGVCRYVPASKGVSISYNYNF